MNSGCDRKELPEWGTALFNGKCLELAIIGTLVGNEISCQPQHIVTGSAIE